VSEITLYLGNKNYSSWSMRAWLVARLSGVEFREELFNLADPATRDEIARHSPTRRVPAMRHGEVAVHDSLAISEYLAELRPDAGLWPLAPAARAAARAVVAEMHSGFPALRDRLPLNVRARTARPAIDGGLEAEIDRVGAVWRESRERFGDRFLFGDRMTIADAFYAPVVSRFRTYGIRPGDAEQAYADAVWTSPAVSEWRVAAEAEPWSNPTYDALL
jgi:glutathione S-transferase